MLSQVHSTDATIHPTARSLSTNTTLHRTEQSLSSLNDQTEQSHSSFNHRTDEFYHLNANLQTYLDEIRNIDDNNQRRKEDIEQIRTNYLSTLEQHLEGLQNDFGEQRQKLTDEHSERYKSKLQARRLTSECEETKRRIQFVKSNEKEQMKRRNHLQKHERTTQNGLRRLNEQLQKLEGCVEYEKQLHGQAMHKVDQLYTQLEQTCVQRWQTEVISA
jgi:chromosome segregation ATPase